MAFTSRADLIIPEILAEAIKSAFTGRVALSGTPAAILNMTMPSTRGGDKVKVPYFGNIGEFDDVAAEGNALTPAKLTMDSEEATVVHAGKAIEITEWAKMAAQYADPYAEMARQVVEGAFRRFDKALIDAAGASLAAAGMVKDVSAAAGAAANLTYDTMIDAKMLWGDEQEDIALLAAHSAVGGHLLKIKDNTGRPILAMPEEGKLGNFAGTPLKFSDRLAPVDGVYTSMILKKSSLVLWANGTPKVMTDTDILADSEIAAVHIYFVAHRYKQMPGSTKGGVAHIKHKIVAE